MKQKKIEAYFIWTKSKTRFGRVFYLHKVKQHILEAFFMFANQKTCCRSVLYLFNMKKRKMECFSSVQNEKAHCWSILHLYKIKITFSKRLLSLQNKNSRFRRYFHVCKWKTHFRSILHLCDIKKKTRFWSVFDLYNVKKWPGSRRVFHSDASKRFFFLITWYLTKYKNNFVVAEFFLSRMCFLKMSKSRILRIWFHTYRFGSRYSQVWVSYECGWKCVRKSMDQGVRPQNIW